MNLPNSITLTRIATVPLLMWILSPAFPANHATHGLMGGEQELIASGVFILASITDGLDGYLARRRKQITTLGMLLDPLADKLMVTAAYIILVAYNPRIVYFSYTSELASHLGWQAACWRRVYCNPSHLARRDTGLVRPFWQS